MHSTGRLSLVARLLAVGAVAASIITSAPMASAAITSNNPPDLTVSVTASPSPTVARSATHTYVLLVTNSSWSGRLRVPGQNLFGNVRVHLTYNFSDERLVSFQDNSGAGFLCYNAAESIGMDIRCVNGSIGTNTTAQISLVTQAPSTLGTFSPTATVDPYNEIAESNESNNTASLTFSTT